MSSNKHASDSLSQDVTEISSSYDDLLAHARRATFVAKIPGDLTNLENSLAVRLRSENSSARSKLQKIYRLADQIMQHAAPHVACHKGCSSCCKMNVQITSDEAALIEQTGGVQAASLKSTAIHEIGKYNGVPCPFLKDGQCSIYEARPLVCRTHVSFYSDDYWCHPSRNLEQAAPVVGFSGLFDAINGVRATKNGVFGDIRDFFPSRTPNGYKPPSEKLFSQFGLT